jgi:hypothetical protein
MSSNTSLSLWDKLADTALTPLILESTYGYPTTEIIHIFGFVLMAGSIAMLDLRLLGFSKQISIKSLSQHLLPWTIAGFMLCLLAGGTLFVVSAPQWVTNQVFLVKTSLLILGGINAAIFHFGAYRHVRYWDSNCSTPLSARVGAIISLLIWATVLACGRLLAYADMG